MNKEIAKCPLCGADMEYKIEQGTHIWICTETCPAVLFEYVESKDLYNLENYLFQDKCPRAPYYALYDLQCDRYLATGRNSRTLHKLKECFLSYISIDYDENDPDWKQLEKESIGNLTEMWEFRIDKQNTPFEEDDIL